MGEYKFPTETIDLPSAGTHYPEESPLKSGKIDIKYMTAREEDILTSTNLIQKGTVIDKLMESLIATPGVHPDQLLIGDLNAVMVAARILAYGKDYPVKLSCTNCRSQFDYDIDLSKLETITPESVSVNGEYAVTLPTGLKITFKLLTRGDERLIKEEVDGLKKFNKSVEADTTTRLRHIITSVNDNTDPRMIRELVDSLIIRDVRALRAEIKKVSPDVNFEVPVQCTECGENIQVRMPLGANFFWPDAGV